MNKLPTHARRWIINLISVFALFASVGAMATTSDTYSIDEDSELNVAAPGVLLNDILPIGTDPINSVVDKVNLTPSINVGPTGSTTFSGNLGGAGRPFQMNSNGSFTYDPRGRFEFLAAGESFVDVTVAGATTQYFNNPRNEVVRITITVTGVNDAPTDFTLSASPLSENSGANFVVGTLSIDAADDADTSDTHTYSLVGGSGSTDNSLFNVNGTDLRATSDLDAEFKTSYSIRVRVSDIRADNGLPAGSSFDKVFTITVTDINDVAPVITAAQSFDIAEDVLNGTDVGTAAATDADVTPATLFTWAEAGGPNAGRFDIDSLGTISVVDNSGFDFDTPPDSYTYNVSVSDGENTSAVQAITINLTDVNEFPPVVTPAQIFDIAEDAVNGAVIGAAAATDGDVSAVFIWTQAGGPNAGRFDIDSLGTISVADNSGFDFESPPTSYTYRVIVSDGVNTSPIEEVTINITDANDVAPTITSANTASVDENAAAVLTVTSTDPDTVGSVSYSLSGGADQLKFAIAVTGELTFSPPADFEAFADADSNNIYLVQVRANDGVNVTDQLITVTLLNLSDTNPTGIYNSATIVEEASYSFQVSDFGFADADGDTFASVALTTLPSDGDLKLSGVSVTLPGTQVLTTDIPNLTFVPDSNGSGTPYTAFTFSVRDNSAADDATPNNFSIDVTAVADVPTLSVTAAAAGNEDAAISLVIAGALLDNDGSETLTFQITGLPTGAVLNNGSDAGGGTWNLNATDTIAVTVTAVADMPNFAVTAAASGSEDVPTTLVITSSLVDTDGSEALTFQFTGVPTGATLNNGTDAGGGVWNLVEADIIGLTIINKLHDDSDFSVNVTATATDNDASSISPAASSIAVTILAVADAPTLVVTSSVTKDEDANPFPLTIAADLVDTDGSESITFEISGVLDSATLSAGADQGGGVWTLTEAEAETGLTLTMDAHVAEDFQIDVRALATEIRDGTTQFSVAGVGRINISVTPKADAVTVTVNPLAAGNEDSLIPLDISGTLVDLDGV